MDNDNKLHDKCSTSNLEHSPFDILVKGKDQQWTLSPSPCIYYWCIVLRDKSKHTCKKWNKMFWIYIMFMTISMIINFINKYI